MEGLTVKITREEALFYVGLAAALVLAWMAGVVAAGLWG